MRRGSAPRPHPSGFTFIELIIVVTVIGLLVGVAVPNYVRARDNARLNMIYHNLRKIEVAKTQYALDAKKTNGTAVDMNLLTTYFRDGKVNDVVHETYVPNPIGTPAKASLPNGTILPPFGPGGDIPAP